MRLWQIMVGKRVLNRALCIFLILCLLTPHYSSMQELLQNQVLETIERNRLKINIVFRIVFMNDDLFYISTIKSIDFLPSLIFPVSIINYLKSEENKCGYDIWYYYNFYNMRSKYPDDLLNLFIRLGNLKFEEYFNKSEKKVNIEEIARVYKDAVDKLTYKSAYELKNNIKQFCDSLDYKMKSPIDELVRLLATLVSGFYKFISVNLARNILQTIAYRVFERLFDLSTALKFFNINNPTPFLLQHWLRGASVGGIAASSEAHALSLLSVRLAAMCAAARHLLGVDMCESIHRFRGGRSYGAVVT